MERDEFKKFVLKIVRVIISMIEIKLEDLILIILQ